MIYLSKSNTSMSLGMLGGSVKYFVNSNAEIKDGI